jgi:hypothetical protein
MENHHPNPPHGCMEKTLTLTPDAVGTRLQAYDCATPLLSPLALAKMAAIMATDGLKRNVTEPSRDSQEGSTLNSPILKIADTFLPQDPTTSPPEDPPY